MVEALMIIILTITVAFVANSSSSENFFEQVKKLASSLNLDFTEHTDPEQITTKGRMSIGTTLGNKLKPAVDVVFLHYAYPKRLGYSFSFHKQNYFLKSNETESEATVQTGDEYFDSVFRISSSHPDQIFALLNEEIKESLYNLKSTSLIGSMHFSDEYIYFEFEARLFDNLSFDKIAFSIQELANHFNTKATVKENLKQNILKSRTASVSRSICIDMLMHDYAGLKEHDEVYNHIIKTASERELFLLSEVAVEGHKDLLLQAFYRGDIELQREILLHLGSNSDPVLFDHMKGLFVSGKMVDEIAEYFSKLKTDESLKALENFFENNLEFPSRVIHALGIRGKKRTIAILDKGRNFMNKTMIDAAIAKIQNRIGVPDQGMLSMEESSDSGGLSIID
jgi:hypothetical protein